MALQGLVPNGGGVSGSECFLGSVPKSEKVGDVICALKERETIC